MCGRSFVSFVCFCKILSFRVFEQKQAEGANWRAFQRAIGFCHSNSFMNELRTKTRDDASKINPYVDGCSPEILEKQANTYREAMATAMANINTSITSPSGASPTTAVGSTTGHGSASTMAIFLIAIPSPSQPSTPSRRRSRKTDRLENAGSDGMLC
jgi:hypothetical protein